MSTYFYWSGVVVHIIAFLILLGFFAVQLIQWYCDWYGVGRDFLKWRWEQIKKAREEST